MAHPEPIQSDPWVDDRMAALQSPDGWQPDEMSRLTEAHARGKSLTARRRHLAAGALAVAVLFVALPVTRAFGARCVEACVNLTARMTQFFRADEPGATAPKRVGATIGSIAADFVGTDVRGARLSLSSHRGRVVVLNFWATWCNPCRDEMPILSDLQNRFGARGLEVIGVSLDEDGWAAVTPFLTELGVTYPIVLGSDEVTAAYGGVPALPATFVIDREGLIIVKRVGPVVSGSLDEVLARLLAK